MKKEDLVVGKVYRIGENPKTNVSFSGLATYTNEYIFRVNHPDARCTNDYWVGSKIAISPDRVFDILSASKDEPKEPKQQEITYVETGPIEQLEL